MGFLKIFSSSDGDKSSKLRSSNSNSSEKTGDIIRSTGGGKHTHQSYNQNVTNGGYSYKEYHGGENSSDRSYNKK